MDDVAAACGVTKMIVYRHFETKEDLYRAVLQRVFDRLLEELEAGREAGELRGLGARIHLTVAREDPDGYRLLWRHAAREPKFAAYAADGRASSVALLRRLVRLDSGDDTFDQWTAEVMLTWLVEATLAWLDHGDPTRDDEYLDRNADAFRALRDTWSRRTGDARPDSHNG
jgi:AcrR family transcriptional regulator